MDSFPPPTKPQIPTLKILDISNGTTFKLEKKDSTGYVFSVPFYSADASSCCFRIKCYVVAHKKDSGYLLLKKLGFSLLNNNDVILKNTAMVSSVKLQSIKEFDYIYLVVIGKYEDVTTKVKYPINEISAYSVRDNYSGSVLGYHKEIKEIYDAIDK